ncbi:MAG TPA: hypothetical protein VFV99_16335 [Kofleriaceae bacterium]|nr:hypothetical protein [Kofleriaceae bacterium]
MKSVSGDELVIQRDNGSELTLKITERGANMTMPDTGDRVNVQYRFDGMEPVVVKIEAQ